MLDLFPDPALSPKPEPLRPSRWETVYRRKTISKEMPRVGTPDVVVWPGDVLTYFDDQERYTTGIVGEVYPKAVLVKPLLFRGQELRPAAQVKIEDFDEVVRLMRD